MCRHLVVVLEPTLIVHASDDIWQKSDVCINLVLSVVVEIFKYGSKPIVWNVVNTVEFSFK